MLILVSVLVALGFTVYKVRKLTITFNNNTFDQYDYKPVNLWNVVWGGIPLVLYVIGSGIDQNNMDGGILNTVVAVLVSMVSVFLLYHFITQKTDTTVAWKSVIVLTLYGFAFMFLIVIFIVLWFMAHYRDCDDCYWCNDWY